MRITRNCASASRRFTFTRCMGCLFLGLGVLTACHRPPDQRPLLPVRVQSVAPAGARGAVRYSGRFEAQTQVTLAFKVGGYVSTIAQVSRESGARRLIQAGDAVRSGDVLATLRKGDYSTKLDELRGARDNARAAAVNAKLDLDRAAQLLRQNAMPQAQFDSVKARHDSLVGEARAAEARVGQASISLSDTELRSPLTGIVLHRIIEVGDLVSPGTTGFIVADTNTMKVLFGVPDSVQIGLQTGLPVTIHTEALPRREFQGLITKIAARADEKSRAFDVEATIDNKDQALKVGMIATAKLDATATQAGAVVPLSAVIKVPDRKDTFAVFVVTDSGGTSVAKLRPVVLGELVRNDVTVTQGLAEGEAVVVRGASIVRDGDRVAVVP
jgi:RND family efflux transporter MFP subunit